MNFYCVLQKGAALTLLCGFLHGKRKMMLFLLLTLGISVLRLAYLTKEIFCGAFSNQMDEHKLIAKGDSDNPLDFWRIVDVSLRMVLYCTILARPSGFLFFGGNSLHEIYMDLLQ